MDVGVTTAERGRCRHRQAHANILLTSQDMRQKKKARKKLTAFEIALSVDALPGARTTAIDAAGYPAESLLRAGATAEPAAPVAALLTVVRLMRGTSTARHALAVADHRGRLALALLGLHMVVGHHTTGKRESVRALESAGATFGTDGRAVQRVRAVRVGGGLMELGRLKISTT